MTSKECETQLKELIEAWDLNEAELNQTDINAIKHLLLENQQLFDVIKEKEYDCVMTLGAIKEYCIDLLKKCSDKDVLVLTVVNNILKLMDKFAEEK